MHICQYKMKEIVAYFIFCQNFVFLVARNNSEICYSHFCLPNSYDKNAIPENGGDFVTMGLKSWITTIRDVDLIERSVTMRIWIEMTWRDDEIRIRQTNYRQNGDIYSVQGDKIWLPPPLEIDYVTSTAKLGIKKFDYGIYLRGINTKTYVRQEFSILVTVACDMEFRNFPFDVQQCALTFGNHYTYCNDVMNISKDAHGSLKYLVI